MVFLFFTLILSLLLPSFATKIINGIECKSIYEIFNDPQPQFSNDFHAPSAVDLYFANDYSDYFVSINNKTWLQSGSTAFRSDGSWADLKLSDTQNTSGYDAFGQFNELIITYEDSATQKIQFSTTFRYYPSNPELLLFTQVYPDGAQNTALKIQESQNMVISSFPSFKIDAVDTSLNLGYVHFGGFMSSAGTLFQYPPYTDPYHMYAYSENPQFGTWSTTGSGSLRGGIQETGPLAIFDDALSNTIVISPLTDHMAVNDNKDAKTNVFEYGLVGNISSVPKDFSVSFILTLTKNGGGINKAMQEWGDRQLQYFGVRKKGNSHDRDYTLQYLGYSTDNGAYYYYHTEPNKNYEQTMIDIANHHKSVSLPTKWVLLDSWWYYKGTNGGVKNWSARSDIFPHGLSYLQNATGWKVQAHNRYWSLDNDYRNDFDFTCDGYSCLPTNYSFWTYLFGMDNDVSVQSNGLLVYEQDWIRDSTVIPKVIDNVEFGRQWILDMAQSAFQNDISIQLCMDFPRHTMTSVEAASITQARASDDYHPGNDQWRIGISSIFNSAIDIAPSKDNFWSKPDVQPNSPYGNDTEPYNRLQALVQSLSNGPYTFSDQIGYSDVDLIMRCCNMDGLVLRPDVSATMIDKYFLNMAKLDKSKNVLEGEVWTSTSVIGNSEFFRFYYVFAVNLDDKFELYPSDVDIYRDRNDQNGQIVDEWIGFETNSTNKYVLFNESSPIELQKSDKWTFEYYTLLPIYPMQNGQDSVYILQGEIDKNIGISSQRFRQILYKDMGRIEVTISGAVGETVNVAFVKYPQLEQTKIACKIGEAQSAVIRMPDATCT